MPVIRAADAATYDMHGFIFRALAGTACGSPDIAVWAVDAPPRSSSPRHTMSRDEVLVVQTGRVVAEVGDDTYDLGPGDALVVPSGSPFRLANPYDQPASVVAVTPTGMQATIGDNTIAPPWAA